jgi:hypothetical protein
MKATYVLLCLLVSSFAYADFYNVLGIQIGGVIDEKRFNFSSCESLQQGHDVYKRCYSEFANLSPEFLAYSEPIKYSEKDCFKDSSGKVIVYIFNKKVMRLDVTTPRSDCEWKLFGDLEEQLRSHSTDIQAELLLYNTEEKPIIDSMKNDVQVAISAYQKAYPNVQGMPEYEDGRWKFGRYFKQYNMLYGKNEILYGFRTRAMHREKGRQLIYYPEYKVFAESLRQSLEKNKPRPK